MSLFHLLLPLRRSVLLGRSLMFLLLPLLQLCVFLVLLLRQFLLLLLVFLIAIRLSLRRAMLGQLRRVVVRRPVFCFRPVVGTWRPVWIVVCPILSRPVVFVRRSILIDRPILLGWTIRRISAPIRLWIVIAASLRRHYATS